MSTRNSISTIGPSTGAATRMNKNEPPHMAESKSNAPTSFAFITLSPLLLLTPSIRQKQQKNYSLLALQIEEKQVLSLMVRSFSGRFWKFSTEAGHRDRTKSPTEIRGAVV